ncbi:RNA polymerase sigma factor [Winogradskyella marincola]|uniref:Sigma-70 family RNA polymerase sigma factor n=1 Tax=Winogradskyella marincola TaxID=3037795 RepID=A0ABT6G031_9FLAO|nr:sigma-70 family RNA polymerase sigma factor [Winogradskyella sp. YYF002]MDG4715402.1 sigma-70 family RNA polymerase sigma factor [Winogradskyella sp. YYF002]
MYMLLSPVLYGICLKYMKNKTEADDVFQDAFIKLFQKIDQYKFNGSFEGWAKRIFVNEALEVLRKKQRRLHIAIEDTIVENSIDGNSDNNGMAISQNELLEHIQQLPDNYRMIFNLFVFEDYSHKKIAEKLNIAEGTSKSLLSRAKRLLRLKINEETSKKVS